MARFCTQRVTESHAGDGFCSSCGASEEYADGLQVVAVRQDVGIFISTVFAQSFKLGDWLVEYTANDETIAPGATTFVKTRLEVQEKKIQRIQQD